MEAPPRIIEYSTRVPGGGDKQALIVRYILRFREAVDPKRERLLSLARARAMAAPSQYDELVNLVEWTLIHMPLPRLQFVGRDEDRFLYEYNFNLENTEGVVDPARRAQPLRQPA